MSEQSCCLFRCRLFKGLTPLWGRQIPYTMMKFGAFENVVQVSGLCATSRLPSYAGILLQPGPAATPDPCAHANHAHTDRQTDSPAPSGHYAQPPRMHLISATALQALYKYVVPKPKAECNKTEQLGVSFAAG